jgi:hypothetical protein
MRHLRRPILYDLPTGSSGEQKERAAKGLIKSLADALRTMIESGALVSTSSEAASIQEAVPKWRESSFLEDGATLVISRGPFDDERKKVLWHNAPQLFLRLIPTSQSVEWTPFKLLDLIQRLDPKIGPLGGSTGTDWDINRHGAVVFGAVSAKDSIARKITQIFLNGEIWGIDGAALTSFDGRSGPEIPIPQDFERRFEFGLQQYLAFATQELEVRFPIKFIAGMTGIEGRQIVLPPAPPGKYRIRSIVGHCVTDEIVHTGQIARSGIAIAEVLRPFFEKVWENCGIPRPSDAD